jgi:hypothetical protein
MLTHPPTNQLRGRVESVLAVDRWLWFLALENMFADDDSWWNERAARQLQTRRGRRRALPHRHRCEPKPDSRLGRVRPTGNRSRLRSDRARPSGVRFHDSHARPGEPVGSSNAQLPTSNFQHRTTLFVRCWKFDCSIVRLLSPPSIHGAPKLLQSCIALSTRSRRGNEAGLPVTRESTAPPPHVGGYGQLNSIGADKTRRV